MRSMRPVALAVFMLLAVGTAAFAEVQVAFNDGRVSIVARNATAGEILTEWARVGQTKIINLERLPHDPVTLELDNVSEREALDVVLRRVSGYVAAPRAIEVAHGSLLDRILVMPSVAPAVPTRPAPVAAKVSAPPAAPVVQADSSTVQAVPEQTATNQTAADQTTADQPAYQAAYQASQVSVDPAYQSPAVDPPYQSSAAYQKAKAYEAMPDASPYGEQGAVVQPEPTVGRRRSSPARSQGAQGSQAAHPHLPAPIFQPQVVVESVKGNPANSEPWLQTTAGAAPAPSESAQATFSSRHPIEVIDPREYHFQMPLQVAAPKGATQPPSGVAVPGAIVQSPKPGGPK
jgi:hypothetical protein